ncbi:MAG: XisI protein [Pyrinomonadaceae bacterium]
MGKLENIREIVEHVLLEYTKIPYAYGDLQCRAIFDRAANSYLLVTIGWEGPKRVHGILVHIDIIDKKIWIQRDGTEEGVAYALEKAGIPRSRIVLGFHPPEVRPHTEYAAA